MRQKRVAHVFSAILFCRINYDRNTSRTFCRRFCFARGRYKNPWCKPAKQRFILIFGYMLEITLWKYVSITHFRDSIWLKYDQIRWCDSFQNPEFHWKALESWIKPQNIWVRSLTDPSRKRASGSDVFLPSADVKYLKNVCVNGSNLIDSSTSTKSGP